MLQITLVKELRLGPREVRVVKAKLNHTSQNTKEIVGILGPTSNLAAHSCDFVKELWTGAEEVYIPINNWSTSPIVVPRDQAVGEIEEISIVGRDDPVWEQSEEPMIARIETQELLDQQNKLKEQLVIGDGCSEDDKQAFIKLLCA